MADPPAAHAARRNAPTLSPPQRRAVALVRQVCAIAGDPAWITATRADFVANGIADAVQRHEDAPIYTWLISAFMFQGISDAAARSYLENGGGVTHADVTRGLAAGRCKKLSSFWTFEGCGFQKTAWVCAVPKRLRRCPLPRHDLRNGRLNQAAYSLRLFMRDLCDDDLVGWIDHRLAQAGKGTGRDRIARLGTAIIDPLKGVFGVADKVLSMALSDLLTGADAARQDWVAAGGGMIVVDTLVHNWLARTGVLDAFDARHIYGPQCYGPTGCAALIRRLARRIDARRYNPDHPRTFPRFVQKAIWRFCAMDHQARCNGVKIDDRKPCEDLACPLDPWCARTPLWEPLIDPPQPGAEP